MKKFFTIRGLALKNIIWIFSSITIVFAVIIYYNYKVSKDMITQNIEDRARHFTLETVSKINVILSTVERIPKNITKILENSSYSDEDLLKTLKLIVENNNEISGAAIAFEPFQIKREKKYFAPYFYKEGSNLKLKYLGGDNDDYFSSDWYQIPKQLDKPVWSEPYFNGNLGNIPVSTISVPLYKIKGKKHQFIGIMTADISLNWLQEIVSRIKVSQSGYGFLISKTGRIITHPIHQLIMNETIFSIAEERNYPALREIGRKMISGKTDFEKPDYRSLKGDKSSWISYAPVPVNSWSLGIVYPIDELLKDVNKLNRTVFFIAIAGCIFLLLVTIFISESITRPLRKLVSATREMTSGNYDIEVPITKSKDEIGDLSLSFAHLQKALKDTIYKLQKANYELEDYSTSLEEKVSARTIELNRKNNELESAYNNVKTLSIIGQKITSSLNIEFIFDTIYESVSSLLDATVFLILLYNKEKDILECKLSMENSQKLPEFSFSMQDKNRFAVWCVDNKQEVYMNDVDTEYSRYITYRSKPKQGNYVQSLIYIPLIVESRIVGVISVQSYNRGAYTQLHLNILKNIAAYAAIAIDNAYAYDEIKKTNKELNETQAQLIQSEKMASLGQLTAGIAHEIKNPLNFINNFAELSIDISEELTGEINCQKDKLEERSANYINELLTDLSSNVKKINQHGKRADNIIKGMLLHSRGKPGEFQKTDINSVLAEYVNLSYHGFRALDKSFNIKIEAQYDSKIELLNVVPQDISRVFLNLLNNACYSVHEKKKERKDSYSPVLSVFTEDLGNKIQIRIRDNGKGIPQDVLDKIFNPFFTTKPAGQGTGLGLSISYDIIVHEHKGELKVESKEGEFAQFTIVLPK